MFMHVVTPSPARPSLKRTTLSFVVIHFGLLCLAIPSSAAVICVKPDGNDGNNGLTWDKAKRTVSGGLKAAKAGDHVWVAAGTYVERITLKKEVALYGGLAGTEDLSNFNLEDRDLFANETILDGNNAGAVVTANDGATASCRIDGFTITRGYSSKGAGLHIAYSSPSIVNNKITENVAPSGSAQGAGIYLINSSSTITGNTIERNQSSNAGGGLYLEASAPDISGNTIVGNFARSGGGLYLMDSDPTLTSNKIAANRADAGSGGGLYLYRSSPTITANTIADNYASRGGGLGLAVHSSGIIANNFIAENSASEGGGLSLSSSSSSTILNNIITGNHAQDGGGVRLDDSSPTFANNVIRINSASRNGGGLYLVSASEPTLVNDTIAGNHADGDGGGMYIHSSSLAVVNTVVAFNSSGIYRFSGDVMTLRYNCVYGNTEYNYAGVTDPTGTDGNISSDPLFGDASYGNYHIQPDSPCLDSGDNSCVIGDRDLDDQARVQPDGGTVDIGADESDGANWSQGPYAIIRVRPDGDDSADGSSWDSAKRTIQAAIDAAAIGGEVWIQSGTYYECIRLWAYVHLYGGFIGSESSREQRDWRENITILDAQQRGTVVTVRAGEFVSTVDGFTVTHGSARVGGGLVVTNSSPSILNCTITGNEASRDGGGLFVGHASPKLVNNSVSDNLASNSGGGLALEESFSLIAGSTITGNVATSSGGGASVRSSAPTIVNSTLAGNRADMGGGGLSLWDSSPILTNITLAGNTAKYFAGGIELFSSSPVIANSIVALGSSGIYADKGSKPTLRYNCVHGNTAYDYSGLDDPTGTNGNISADPLFVDSTNGDFHLSSGSPCIDAADNAAVPDWLTTDLDGNPRFIDDPDTSDTGNGTSPIIDMGAFEYQPPPFQRGDVNCDGGVDFNDIDPFISALISREDYESQYPGCNYLNADINADGSVDFNDIDGFVECLIDNGCP